MTYSVLFFKIYVALLLNNVILYFTSLILAVSPVSQANFPKNTSKGVKVSYAAFDIVSITNYG
jgi:hypothetical protein